MTPQRYLPIVGAALVLCTGCVGSGEIPASIQGQIVGEDDRPLGPGLVLIEKGIVHAGAYQTGALIDEEGKFWAELSEGGMWGLHLFHTEYNYLPLQIEIADHQQATLTSMNVAWGVWMDLTGEPRWPDQPTDSRLVRLPTNDNPADDPILHSVTLSYLSSELLELKAVVTDPDGDLSRMVLAYDLTTHNGMALNPPSPPDDKGNYPNGTYTLPIYLDPAHVPGESQIHFIVSDNLCNNTPIVVKTIPPK